MRKDRLRGSALHYALAAMSLAWTGCGGPPKIACDNCGPSNAEYLYSYSYFNSEWITVPVDMVTGQLGSATSTSGPGGSEGIIATPSGKFLYVSDNQRDEVEACAINPSTGALTAIAGSPFAVGGFLSQSASGLAMDPKGKFLFVTELGSGMVAVFTIDSSTGALTPVTGSPFPAGNGAALATVDPSGKFLYVSDLFDAEGSISAYSINPGSGALSPVPGSPFPTMPNGGPGFLVIDPSGKFLYVGLDGTAGANFIAGFAIANNGALTLVPGSPFSAGSLPSGVAVDPAGRFLYVGNDGDGTISGFEIEASTGALSQMSGSPFSAGVNVNGLTTCTFDLRIDPSGKALYSGDACNPSILSFGISSSGTLNPPVVTDTPGANPMYLAFAKVR